MSDPGYVLVPAPPAQDIIEAAFGPFVAGIMLQQLLMGVIVVQVYDYFRIFSKDTLFHRFLVAGMFAVTLLQCSMDFQQLYRCAVLFYGDFDKFDDSTWTLWWELAVTAIIGSLSQAFFLGRCWTATKSKVVLAIGTAGILASLGSGIGSSIEFQNVHRLSEIPSIKAPVLTWLICTAVVDLAIAAVLVWSLTRVKLRFKKTETVVTKIVRLTFTTSALTATVAVINVVLYMVLPHDAYHLLPQLCMGKLYVISAMVTLSSRSELREMMEAEGGSPYETEATRRTVVTQGASKMGLGTTKQVDFAAASQPVRPAIMGIQISTTTYVRDDNDNYVDIDTDSTRKAPVTSDIELGPVSRGRGEDLELAIQYPDGRVAKGDDESDSEIDYSVAVSKYAQASPHAF